MIFLQAEEDPTFFCLDKPPLLELKNVSIELDVQKKSLQSLKKQLKKC